MNEILTQNTFTKIMLAIIMNMAMGVIPVHRNVAANNILGLEGSCMALTKMNFITGFLHGP